MTKHQRGNKEAKKPKKPTPPPLPVQAAPGALHDPATGPRRDNKR
ncbi:hypothetical protein [Roseateles amylovorans]|jgi:hypothetical protein|uniref:Uncharacterized protein n=1 Tax=Roseateles amylovorans TaxID=2978473 RepID=A0ABY6B375_9BURK|nr:hypothetical protein [Roseateles amylovorans]UXH79630.1 hypothetical protein N4261_06865 [Roseateles amylovorans]